jgi:hypothetical protein
MYYKSKFVYYANSANFCILLQIVVRCTTCARGCNVIFYTRALIVVDIAYHERVGFIIGIISIVVDDSDSDSDINTDGEHVWAFAATETMGAFGCFSPTLMPPPGNDHRA